jgi:glutamate synthase (NADPH/NADH) small chain
MELGRNITLPELQKKYDAVYLGYGVGVARPLEIKGEQLEGVVDAISFIYDLRSNDLNKIKTGDQVVVIGMGMTAIDAATQAKRLGAAEVTMLYRRTQEEMPCTEHELNIAKLDGCKVIWLAAPKEVLGVDGKVAALKCDVMELGESDAGGRRSAKASGREFIIDTDMIIKATGQMPFETLTEEINVENKNGKISISNAETNIAGVFAGGDCVNGGREVVDAVQAGKEGAGAIVKYLFP